MVRDQLHCLIGPPGRHDAASLMLAITTVRDPLAQLLRTVGRIHYATLFILPPPPGSSDDGEATSLALELVVDEATDTDALVDALASGGLSIFWTLFGEHSSLKADAPAGDRQRWLSDFMRARLHRADGGFVGTRDRTVEDIETEDADLQVLRAEAETMRRQGLGAAEIAARFALPGVAPPRVSPWCDPRLTPLTRARRILTGTMWGAGVPVVVAFALLVLAMIGVLPVAVARWTLDDPIVFGSAASGAGPALALAAFLGVALAATAANAWGRHMRPDILVASAFPWVAVSILTVLAVVVQAAGLVDGANATVRAVLPAAAVLVRWGAILIVMLLFSVAAIAAATWIAVVVVPPYRKEREIVLLGIAIAFGALWCVHAVLHWILLSARAGSLAAHLGESIALGDPRVIGISRLDAIVFVAMFGLVVVAAIVMAVARWGAHHRRSIDQALGVPGPTSAMVVERAQQTHESVVACEAELFNRCNHMISLTELRGPALLRWVITLATLRAVGLLADTWFVAGVLGHARGIHFAHWHLIDRRRLLFLSNYDGDFSGYLDDFIHGASEGVNMVWRNTRLRPRRAAIAGHPAIDHPREFPTTLFGVFRGCAHEQWFKAYVRDSMLPHLFRFEAYDIGCQNILRARSLLDARIAPRNPINDDRILRALES